MTAFKRCFTNDFMSKQTNPSLSRQGPIKPTKKTLTAKEVKSDKLSKSLSKKASKTIAKKPSRRLELSKEVLLSMHEHMVTARVLEERLIKLYRTGDAFFWIGGTGEEAFGVPLGMLTHRGQGPEFDYLHLHYRGTPTMIALGMPMIDSIRLQMNRATDPSTGGRNFCNHYCFSKWNVVPVGSPIEVQYGMAIGTGVVQRRLNQQGKKGITIVTGGDAGSAEGDFASCLIWASRPGQELPMLITVQNNRVGISTDYGSQHGEKFVSDRGRAFGIRTAVVNGNDAIETYLALQAEMAYIRKTGKPVLMEFMVSRLYGHSSATGANREKGEDCIESLERKMIDAGMITSERCQEMYKSLDDESKRISDEVRKEAVPAAESIWDHVYAGSENADWRKF